MPLKNSNDLAQKIAKILEAESHAADFAIFSDSIEKINERLVAIESQLQLSKPDLTSQISNFKSAHPSMDRFAVAEAIADEIFSDHQKEKACTFEPNGKPCDHCSMCSSRGF